MKLVEVVEDVKTYAILSGQLLYGDTNDRLYLDGDVFLENIDAKSVLQGKDYVLIRKKKVIGAFLYNDGSLKELKEISPIINQNSSLNKVIGAVNPRYKKGRGFCRDLVCLDRESFEIENVIVENIYYRWISYNEDYIFYYSDDNICAINYLGQEVWRFSILEIIENKRDIEEFERIRIKRLIGVIDEVIWLALSNYSIIALSIQDGSRVCVVSELSLSMKSILKIRNKKGRIPRAISFDLDYKNKRLFTFSAFYYYYFDIETRELLCLDMSEALNKIGVTYFRGSIEYGYNDDTIYTIGEIYEKNIVTFCLLAFNTITLELNLIYTFNGDVVSVRSPRYKDGRLYQRSRSGKLYVFE